MFFKKWSKKKFIQFNKKKTKHIETGLTLSYRLSVCKLVPWTLTNKKLSEKVIWGSNSQWLYNLSLQKTFDEKIWDNKKI